ncbi:FtsX-like permease family protein [Myxococcota bacterium]|nr:FtsX-like permease family protein [Myxococcota bacterium]
MLTKISWRNLRRRPLRSLLTGMMIVGGTIMVVFSLGVQHGSYGMITDLACKSGLGHLQVQREGFLDKPTIFKTLKDAPAAIAALEADPAVVGVSGRVEVGGLFAHGERTVGGLLMGVDPVQEGTVTTLPKRLVPQLDPPNEGAWLPATRGEDDPLPVVLDETLANKLKAKIGDEISFMSYGADGSIIAELFVLIGLMDAGDGDTPLAFTRLQDAQALLVLGDRLHRLVVAVKALKDVKRVQRRVSLAEGDVLLGWDEVMPGLAKSIESDRAGGYIFLIIVLLVVLLGVANTMLMSVFERTREFGVLLALGTSPRQIVAMTLIEAGWLSALSVLVGAIIGGALNAWLGEGGIPLGEYSMDFGGMTIDRMPAINDTLGLVVIPAVIMIFGVLAALMPALRAAKLDPSKALRIDG